jgi:hypothetical protein
MRLAVASLLLLFATASQAQVWHACIHGESVTFARRGGGWGGGKGKQGRPGEDAATLTSSVCVYLGNCRRIGGRLSGADCVQRTPWACVWTRPLGCAMTRGAGTPCAPSWRWVPSTWQSDCTNLVILFSQQQRSVCYTPPSPPPSGYPCPHRAPA